MRETLLLDVSHRQVVFTIPKRLRVFFKYKRRLLGDLCRSALRFLTRYFEVVAGSPLTLLCPKCGGTMKIIFFLTEYAVVDRIIDHLKLTFVAERPPPPQVAPQELLMAADVSTEYFS